MKKASRYLMIFFTVSFSRFTPSRRMVLLVCGGTFFFFYPSENRGRKRHINIWHINTFSVTPVTDPPGREPDSSRPGTQTKTFMFLGFRTQNINFWPLATGRETPPARSGDPPPPGQPPEKFVYVYVPFPFLKSTICPFTASVRD